MSSSSIPPDVIGKLREGLVAFKKDPEAKDILGSKDEVLARFKPTFGKSHLPDLTEEEFKSFLLFENNHHWSGLHRQSTRICEDMTKLRAVLAKLVDESLPLENRLNDAEAEIKGMGKAIITAILIVAYPDRYGVWNRQSEATMTHLGIFPSFERGESFGSRYLKVNGILSTVREDLGVDFWTLDGLWWHMDKNEPATGEEPGEDEFRDSEDSDGPTFGLERHLHEFMRDNWHQLDLAQEWGIYSEPGDEEAGYEYVCDVGRIDLLARHKSEPRWLVIELKRNQTSDQTVGQVLRYIGWIRQHLAVDGEQVEGLVIAHKADEPIKYALSAVPDVKLKLYEVEFRLMNPSGLLN